MAASVSVVGSTQQNTGSSSVAISSYTIVAGQPVFVCFFTRGSVSAPSVSDGTNTYTLSSTTSTTSNGQMRIYVCLNPTAVTGGTLTASWTGTQASVIMACQGSGFTGYSADSANPMTGANGTLQAGVLSSGTFPNGCAGATLGSANATLVAFGACDNVASGASWTEDAAWTSVGSSSNASNGAMMHAAYKNVAATTAVTYKPAYGSSDSTHLWTSNEYAVDMSAGGSVNHNKLLLMGVG